MNAHTQTPFYTMGTDGSPIAVMAQTDQNDQIDKSWFAHKGVEFKRVVVRDQVIFFARISDVGQVARIYLDRAYRLALTPPINAFIAADVRLPLFRKPDQLLVATRVVNMMDSGNDRTIVLHDGAKLPLRQLSHLDDNLDENLLTTQKLIEYRPVEGGQYEVRFWDPRVIVAFFSKEVQVAMGIDLDFREDIIGSVDPLLLEHHETLALPTPLHARKKDVIEAVVVDEPQQPTEDNTLKNVQAMMAGQQDDDQSPAPTKSTHVLSKRERVDA